MLLKHWSAISKIQPTAPTAEGVVTIQLDESTKFWLTGNSLTNFTDYETVNVIDKTVYLKPRDRSTMTPCQRCEILLNQLKATYKVGLSFGYTGNYGRYGDSTIWYFFTKVLKPNSYIEYDKFQFGGYSGAELDKLADQAETHLEEWLIKTVMPHAARRYRSYRIEGINIRDQRRRLEQHHGFSYGLDSQNYAEICVIGLSPESVQALLPGCTVIEQE